MISDQISAVLSQEFLDNLFPEDRADEFFEALLGDASEGAFDIRLCLDSVDSKQIALEFQLRARPEKCLVCSRTFGLPNVFLRHPIINIREIIKTIAKRLEGITAVKEWRLGETKGMSPDLHMIPLIINI